jgi:hypothetical protein
VLAEILGHLAQEDIGATAGLGMGDQGDGIDRIALGGSLARPGDERGDGDRSSNIPQSGFHVFLPLFGHSDLLPAAAESGPATASLAPLSQVRLKLSIADSLPECEKDPERVDAAQRGGERAHERGLDYDQARRPYRGGG